MTIPELLIVEYLADCADAGVKPTAADFDEWVEWRRGGAPSELPDAAAFRAAYEIGHISKRKDGDYKKVGEGKWQRVGGKKASKSEAVRAAKINDAAIEKARAQIKAGALDKLQSRIDKIKDTNGRKNWLARNIEMGAFEADYGADEFREFIDTADYSPAHKKAMQEKVRKGGRDAIKILFNAAMRIGKGNPSHALKDLFQKVGKGEWQDQAVDAGEMEKIAAIEMQKQNMQWFAAMMTSKETPKPTKSVKPVKKKRDPIARDDEGADIPFRSATAASFKAQLIAAFAKAAEIGAISKDGKRKKVSAKPSKWAWIKRVRGAKPATAGKPAATTRPAASDDYMPAGESPSRNPFEVESAQKISPSAAAPINNVKQYAKAELFGMIGGKVALVLSDKSGEEMAKLDLKSSAKSTEGHAIKKAAQNANKNFNSWSFVEVNEAHQGKGLAKELVVNLMRSMKPGDVLEGDYIQLSEKSFKYRLAWMTMVAADPRVKIVHSAAEYDPRKINILNTPPTGNWGESWDRDGSEDGKSMNEWKAWRTKVLPELVKQPKAAFAAVVASAPVAANSQTQQTDIEKMLAQHGAAGLADALFAQADQPKLSLKKLRAKLKISKT